MHEKSYLTMRSSRRCMGILLEHEQERLKLKKSGEVLAARDNGVKECSLGTSGYRLFMSTNVKPSWSTVVPASVYFGFATSVIWVAGKFYNLVKNLKIDQPSNNCAKLEKKGAVY